MHEAVPVRGTLVLARERTGRSVFVSGFARRRGSNIGGSGEHRAFGAPMNENCTLWTLRVAWLKAFSLLRFFVAKDQDDAPPRAVANSNKENIQLTQTAKPESSNPAMTQNR